MTETAPEDEQVQFQVDHLDHESHYDDCISEKE
jgi:hypothetical protein